MCKKENGLLLHLKWLIFILKNDFCTITYSSLVRYIDLTILCPAGTADGKCYCKSLTSQSLNYENYYPQLKQSIVYLYSTGWTKKKGVFKKPHHGPFSFFENALFFWSTLYIFKKWLWSASAVADHFLTLLLLLQCEHVIPQKLKFCFQWPAVLLWKYNFRNMLLSKFRGFHHCSMVPSPIISTTPSSLHALALIYFGLAAL